MNNLLIAQGIVITLFLISKIWELLSGKNERQERAIKENTDSINKMNLELAETRVYLKILNESIKSLPKIQSDVDAAHSKIREILKSQ